MNNSIEQVEEVQDLVTKKIPRPPNAFMLYANANRKIMAQKYPTESNKDISKRLGASWKSLDVSEKNDYFDKAKTIDAEHKRKYPNYVYNPKEARIRKAMREATRDRAIGASPMLPRPRSRLPPHADWAQSQDEHLMMNPMDGMRRMETPMCSGYTDNNHFLRPMNGYNKVDTSPMMPNYMQPSPLAQLQQQTDMWHPYQDNIMRPRNLGNSYPHTMMPDMQTQSYHTQEPIQETPTNLIMEKSRDSPGCSQQPQQIMSPHQITDENSHHSVVSNINSQKETAQTPPASNNLFMEVKMQQENIPTSIMQNTTETENPYTAVNDTMMGYQNELSKETVAVKKPRGRPPTKKIQQTPPQPPPKSLPDFNEAFGSTERGRFLSPPDPRLNKSYLDMLFDDENSFIKFEDFQI